MDLTETKDYHYDMKWVLSVNSDWPGIKLLRKKGEFAIDDSVSNIRIKNYFSDIAPSTGHGALKLAAEGSSSSFWTGGPYFVPFGVCLNLLFYLEEFSCNVPDVYLDPCSS